MERAFDLDNSTEKELVAARRTKRALNATRARLARAPDPARHRELSLKIHAQTKLIKALEQRVEALPRSEVYDEFAVSKWGILQLLGLSLVVGIAMLIWEQFFE